MRHRTHHPQLKPQEGALVGNLAEDQKPSTASLILQRNGLAVLCVILLAALGMSLNASSSSCNDGSSLSLRNPDQCAVSMGKYRGPVYNSPQSGTIGQPKCLVESKWLKVARHTVKFPGSNNVFDDWLWIDYHDRINVVVEDVPKPGLERSFLVFEQSKYALDGKQSLAIIGGIIEPGEEPEHAARREVNEEMGLNCQNFHFLGRYRTDVNRGMGWVNGFLATTCSKDTKKHEEMRDEVGAADTERQDVRSLSLSEMRLAASKGEFLEVQWTATVAQALLHPELMD